MDVNAIFNRAKKDTSLLANLDIDELLKTETTEFKSIDTILTDNINAIKTLGLSNEETQTLCNKLTGYRYIENLFEIHKGKYIRWIRLTTKSIKNGGFVTDVRFFDNGSHVLCRNLQNQLFQIKFDDCLIFQRMTTNEQMVLMAGEGEPTVKRP
jgi:hypothetical protein